MVQSEIQNLYKKIKSKFERSMEVALKKKKILPNKNHYTLSADFDDVNRWKISTTVHKDYSEHGENVTREELVHVQGALMILKHDIPMDPSFGFMYDVVKNKISINNKEVDRIIAAEKERQEWATYDMDDENAFKDATTVYDSNKEAKIAKLKRDINPALEQIGFPKEERNLMILAALDHHSFQEDMPIEAMVGLALKLR